MKVNGIVRQFNVQKSLFRNATLINNNTFRNNTVNFKSDIDDEEYTDDTKQDDTEQPEQPEENNRKPYYHPYTIDPSIIAIADTFGGPKYPDGRSVYDGPYTPWNRKQPFDYDTY